MWRKSTAFAVFIYTAGTLPTFAQIIVASRSPSVIPIDKSGAGSILFTANNPTAASLPLQVSVSDFFHDDGVTRYPLNCVSVLTPATDADKTKIDKHQLAAHDSVDFKLSVTQAWDAGEAVAEIRNNLVKIDTVRALRIPVAYNVQLDASSATVLIAPDSEGLVTILNNDPMNYRCSWELVTRGKVSSDPSQPTLLLPASGSARVNLTRAAPPTSWIAGGTLKDDLADSTLVLHPLLGPDAPPQAPKLLPLKLRLRRFTSAPQEFWEFGWTFFCLLIGALASLAARYFIPNALGAVKLRRDLRLLDTTREGMSDHVDSRWRVLLAYNIETCRAGLHDFPWAFPAFASRLVELQTQQEMIAEWVNIAYAVGCALDDARELLQSGNMPPSVLELIERECQEALKPIETGRTNADELQGMRTSLKAAQDLIASIRAHEPIAVLDSIIQEREKRLQTNNALTTLMAAFPSFTGLLTQVQTNLAVAPSAASYVDRDLLSLKAELLMEYRDLNVRFGAGVIAPAGGAVAASPALSRLRSGFPRLESYIAPDSILTLQKARLFLTEMRQDYYTPLLSDAAAATPPGLAIHAVPLPIYAGLPVHFSLRFAREELNEIAAIQEWTCNWNLDDGSPRETGWDTYHRFDHVGRRNVSATIVDLQGDPVATSAPIARTFTVSTPPTSRRSFFRLPRLTPEAKIEAAHLLIVLAVAFFGVFATARAQIETMSTFSAAAALIGIGFGADTLKNLIAQKAPDKAA
jgi:hypothetical protein